MTGWDEARALAAGAARLPVRDVPLRTAIGAVPADDAVAVAPVPHYDSAAMDGWAVAGPPPWRIGSTAQEVVTGGLLPPWAQAVVPVERARQEGGAVLADAPAPAPGAHVRRAGEEAPAGAVLVPAGRRLSPAHVAVLGIAGLDAVSVRRSDVALVLTGDEVDAAGRPAPGRVRDAFDPLLPAAVERLGGRVVRLERTGDDPDAIAAAVAGPGDLVVTVGGTGRSRADRLRLALAALPGGARTVFDGVAMRPGHPALLSAVGRPAGPDRPVLSLPGNPLAAVAVLLSFLPPLLDAQTAAVPREPGRAHTAVALPGWHGTSLVPCTADADGLRPAPAARPNMLRGLAVSDVLAVVPPDGAAAGDAVRVLPLPW